MTGGDIVALAGIAGTLLGTGLGAWLTWKVLERQLKHADKTRFHERRLDIYATYTGAITRMWSRFQIGGEYEPAEYKVVSRNFDLLRLVGTPAVKRAGDPMLDHVSTIMKNQGPPDQPTADQFNTDMAKLVLAMRAEIGTDD